MRRPVMVQVLTGPGRFGLFFLGAGLSNIAGSNRALTIVLSLVPPEELGRVMALWTVAFLGGRPTEA